jgi:transposase-like protein
MSRHTKSGSPSLSTVQQSVADALGSGSTISGAAEEFEVSRVTIYNWIKTRKDFAAAIQQARAEFVLSRRDDLQYLSDRALESVIAILDNPSAPSGVLLRAAMFILKRPQPKTGWCMPEPVPEPGREKLFDSVLIEHDYDNLPCLQNPVAGAPASADPEPPSPSESAAGRTDFTKSYTFTKNSGVNPPAHRQT